ncbi:MAG: M28 family peptidase [Candidatus Parcubacteria bacterium]|nr:M28 family peptidase [Candidatus Parcubacteria bacterium]
MYSQINLIKKLCDLGERQLGQEIKASKLLMAELEKYKVKYKVQSFPTKVPVIKSVSLTADNSKIKAKGACFVSGMIKNKFKLVAPIIKPLPKDEANINYNPKCAEISQSDFYFVPSLAVNKKDVSRIKRARYVEGEIKVTPQKHRSLNILVGNLKNPKNIIFAHYDSIGPGAVDDGSGVAALMRLIIDYPKLEKDNLFVLAGNEELSYDTPYYWGRGYRAFEKKYAQLLNNAKKILVVDGVGFDKPLASRKMSMIKACFPILKMKNYQIKTYILYGNQDFWDTICHSELDKTENIKAPFLNQANRKILKLMD